MTATVTEDDTYLYVETDTCPPYANPGWSNPNTACQLQKTFKIPLSPRYALVPIPLGERDSEYNGVTYLKTDPVPVFGSLGILVSGVEIFGVGSPCGFSTACPDEGAPTEYVDAVDAEGHTVDSCSGHPSPSGGYHIHSGLGMNSTERREACRLPVDEEGQHSQLLGWMYDGFGLYGRLSLSGLVPTDLDECGGHVHEIDGIVATYHYHIVDQFPWTIGCFKGCPETSNNEMELSAISSNPEYGCSEGSTDGARERVCSFTSLVLLMCAALMMNLYIEF